MYPPFIFVKKINIFIGVICVSDDVTATKAIKRVNDKMF